MDERAGSIDPPVGWAKKNLVALGSVAVVSVYTAGYFRTEEAATRFAGESERRHGAAVAAPSAAHVDDAGAHAAPVGRVSEPPVIKPSSSAKPRLEAVPHPNATVTASPAPAAAPAAVPAARTDSQPVVAPPVPAPAPAPAKIAAPAADSTTAAASKPTDKGGLRDGTYLGWGTSRHGDIQATVMVENGKITTAWISECRTQYSCSWISALPPEVSERQSAEVDYVSGATQSSNAFYYAVVQALSKAK